MNDSFQKTFEQASAFQKIWMDTFTRMAQANFSVPLQSTPPEFLRQLRGGIFQALSQSWEEYMRTPQFGESMKAMMDNAIALRKASSDFFTQARHDFQGVAREDIDSLLAALGQAEARVLNRVEDIAERLDQLERKLDGAVQNGNPKGLRRASARQRKTAIKKVKKRKK